MVRLLSGMRSTYKRLPNKTLDNVKAVPYNGCVDDDKGKKMIIRRETLNEISTLKSKFNPDAYATWEGAALVSIARTLNLAVADVAAAIKAFKL